MQIDLFASVRAIVRARTREAVAVAAVQALAASRSVVLARVWIARDGDLRLAASAGTPSGGGSYGRSDGEFREMGIADRTIAEVAATHRPFIVGTVRGDEEWLINPSWAARQGVRAFMAVPLVDEDRCGGVLAVLDRDVPTPDVLAHLQLIADVTAALLAPASPPETSVRTRPDGVAVLTRAELRRLERANIEAALARTNGKVFGIDGAAALLNTRPTTLASRMKALGIRSGATPTRGTGAD